MKPSAANAQQIQKLQVLYSQACRRSLDFQSERAARIAWAAELVKRDLDSFRDLTKAEAAHLIDALQAFLGVEGRDGVRKFVPAQQTRRAGLDGRHDGTEFKNAPQLARAEDVDKIDRLRLAAGWTRERFDAWLQSTRSPLRRQKWPRAVRTTADANKVIWALRAVVKSSGGTERERTA